MRRPLLFALLAAGTSSATAQVALPGPAQIPQIQKRFEPPIARPEQPKPGELPTPPGVIAPPPGADAVRLTLREVSFTGMTVYTPDEIRPLYASMVGRDISLADLYALADQVTARYHRDGYLLSIALVPEQQVESGAVTIQVVEGHVDQVHFTGKIDGPKRYPQGFASGIAASRPLKADALERNVLLIGDLPGVNVQSVLKPSPSQFGAADLDVVIQQLPIEGFVSIDNKGSRYVGPWALSGGVSLYSRLGLYEQIDLTAAGDPFDSSMLYLQGAITVPIHAKGALAGDTIQLSGLYSWAKPDLPEQLFPFHTRSQNVEWHATYFVPVIRSRERNLSARLSFIWRDLENRITDLPDDNLNPSREHVRIIQPRLTLDFVDPFNGVTLIDVAGNIGLNIFGASQKGDPRLVRQYGDGEFFYVTGTLARLQPVTKRVGLFLRFDAQLANGPLPTTERFGVGGSTFGVGFAPGTLTGDDGFGARAELRYGLETKSSVITGFQIYLHGDYGWTHDQKNIGPDSHDLASVGLGARINIFKNLAFNPEVAQQISGRPTDCLDCSDEFRFLFNVTQRF
ncbi:MAG TPA: POTRA domain-containing protein [Sphingobium sp.]|uniref:ShlB/FhaC/HecB family hemolysin secretion/activation protein n=1 Tax=Sphingobium sp. TaxID=1912891 RepID=UPI002ED16FDD